MDLLRRRSPLPTLGRDVRPSTLLPTAGCVSVRTSTVRPLGLTSLTRARAPITPQPPIAQSSTAGLPPRREGLLRLGQILTTLQFQHMHEAADAASRWFVALDNANLPEH